jgi:hypothetical protein
MGAFVLNDCIRIHISNSSHDFAISPQVSREFCLERSALGK